MPSRVIRQSGFPAKVSQFDMQCVGRVVRSFPVASANRRKLAFFAPLGIDNRPGRGERFPKMRRHNAEINDTEPVKKSVL